MSENEPLSVIRGYTYNKYLKRLMDVVLATILLILFSPIRLVISILIKLDSKGPVLADIPERVGRGNSLFVLHKFRSMIVNSHFALRNDKKFIKLYEEYKKNSFKLHDDPRITRVGKIIRKYSLDELPQFINVIKGEMSIVGPRAYYPDELDEQQRKYPNTRPMVTKVLSVRPGITGLWQVSGRSEVNFDKRIAMDAYYVDHVSLLEDVRIIFKTPWAMISAKGAV